MFIFKNYLTPFLDEVDTGGGAGENGEEVKTDVVDAVDEKPTDTKNDSVPLAKYLELKNKSREYERQLKEVREKEIDKDIIIAKTDLKKKYIDKGFDDDLAESLAEEIASLKAEVKKSNFKDLDDSSLDDDLKDLSKDAFFEDAPTFKKEIQTRITDFKKKGIELSAEDAYLQIRGRQRIKELQTDLEQKAALKRREGEEKEVPKSSGASSKDPYPLDETDKKALAGLQKAQPNAGWTAERYFKLMKS